MMRPGFTSLHGADHELHNAEEGIHGRVNEHGIPLWRRQRLLPRSSYFLPAVFFRADFAAAFATGLAGAAAFGARVTPFFAVLLRPRAGFAGVATATASSAGATTAGVAADDTAGVS